MIRTTFVISLLLLNVSAFSESKEILKIREIYKNAQDFQKENMDNAIQYFQYLDESEKGVSDWIKLDKNAKNENNLVNVLRIFKNRNRITSILLEEGTPTGDWVHTTEYYFYENQKTAFIFSNLSTFHGNAKIERRFYFDENFRKIRELKSIYDLQTNKERNKNDTDFLDRKVEIAQNTDVLFKILNLKYSR